MYFRLQANYDGLASEYYPDPPTLEDRAVGFGEKSGQSTRDRQERALYEVGKRFTALADEDERLRMSYTDHRTGESVEALVDMVLGTDGPNSVGRRICGREAAAQRVHAGYVNALRKDMSEFPRSEKNKRAVV